MKIERCIEVYKKDGEDFIEEHLLKDFNLELVSKYFDVPPEDPLMYYKYEVEEKHIELFPDMKFDFSKYQYRLACYQV